MNHTEILRSVRDLLVEFFIAAARLLFVWLPGDDAVRGRALMAFHPVLMSALVMMFFLFPRGHPLRFFIVAVSLVVVASQWLLGGCVITRAEQRLTGEKITILDPFLALANIQVNRETRNAATVGMSTVTCGLLLWNLVIDLFIPLH
jgi:hypothetical protein